MRDRDTRNDDDDDGLGRDIRFVGTSPGLTAAGPVARPPSQSSAADIDLVEKRESRALPDVVVVDGIGGLVRESTVVHPNITYYRLTAQRP